MSKTKSKSFRFTRLYLENWRNFVQNDVELQNRIFLVGPNASGKSNLLDVFRFLHDIVSVGGGFQEAIRKRGGVSSLRCLAARRYSNILIHVNIGNEEDLSAWEYEIHFNQDNLRRPIIKKEKVIKHGKLIFERPDVNDKNDSERLIQTYLEQVYANQNFRDIADFFSTVRYLHIVPQLVREPDRSVGKKNDPYGGDFLEQIAHTQDRTRNARLRRIKDALSFAVPQLKELEMIRDERGTPHLRGKYEHWRFPGAWHKEDQFSDGTLRLMGLLWVTLDGNGPLLLEEPELSLHPEVIKYIPQMFARIQRKSGRQVIMSTHSTEVLQDEGIGLDEVLLVQPGSEGATITPANTIKEAELLLEGGLSVADAIIPQTRPQKIQQLSLFGD
jgi:predicted ATPase